MTNDFERLIRRLQHQYTTQNDGGGRAGCCRVNSGDLLDLLQKVERLSALVDPLSKPARYDDVFIEGVGSLE